MLQLAHTPLFGTRGHHSSYVHVFCGKIVGWCWLKSKTNIKSRSIASAPFPQTGCCSLLHSAKQSTLTDGQTGRHYRFYYLPALLKLQGLCFVAILREPSWKSICMLTLARSRKQFKPTVAPPECRSVSSLENHVLVVLIISFADVNQLYGDYILYTDSWRKFLKIADFISTKPRVML